MELFSKRRRAVYVLLAMAAAAATQFPPLLFQDAGGVSPEGVNYFSTRIPDSPPPYAYLKPLIEKCGDLCTVSEGEFEDSLFFKKRNVPVNCKSIFSDEVFILHGHEQVAAPEEIPERYLSDYTLNGQVPVLKFYFDQKYLGYKAGEKHFEVHAGEKHFDKQKYFSSVWEKNMVEEMISLANKGELMGNYRTEETNHLINGLKMANGVKNGRVLVIGSESPWVEAAVLSVGAREVVTLEYGKIVSEHPLIKTMTPGEFRKKYLSGTLGLFDAIVTFSSVEHSGLGRYGDALNPWGDVLEIARAYCVCKPGGSLVIAVMTEDGNDAIQFNAHRTYGVKRWPYLASNWQQVHREPDGEQLVYVFSRT
jgi:hypothetical protein